MSVKTVSKKYLLSAGVAALSVFILAPAALAQGGSANLPGFDPGVEPKQDSLASPQDAASAAQSAETTLQPLLPGGPVAAAPAPENNPSAAQPVLPSAESLVDNAAAAAKNLAAVVAPASEPAAPETATETASDSALPLPGFIEDNPGMTLDAGQASGDAPAAPGQGFDFEKSAEQLEAEKRAEAFKAALEGMMPLRPDEIRKLLEHFDRTQESVELPVYPAPKPEVAVETVSLDPGAKPVTVKVAYGNVTTLSFLDVSGAPWPIEDISWAGNFEVIEAGGAGKGSHIIRITPQSEFATGNMSLRLLTLKTPVIISMETSRDIVHYRFDAIIPDYGPLAKTPLIDKGITIEAGDKVISGVLEGVVPKSAETLDVSGTDGRTTAFRIGGQTYLRTPLTLLSPPWTSSVASADGMRVYQIQDTPVLLLSDKGRMVRARVSERENILGAFADGQ